MIQSECIIKGSLFSSQLTTFKLFLPTPQTRPPNSSLTLVPNLSIGIHQQPNNTHSPGRKIPKRASKIKRNLDVPKSLRTSTNKDNQKYASQAVETALKKQKNNDEDVITGEQHEGSEEKRGRNESKVEDGQIRVIVEIKDRGKKERRVEEGGKLEIEGLSEGMKMEKQVRPVIAKMKIKKPKIYDLLSKPSKSSKKQVKISPHKPTLQLKDQSSPSSSPKKPRTTKNAQKGSIKIPENFLKVT